MYNARFLLLENISSYVQYIYEYATVYILNIHTIHILNLR